MRILRPFLCPVTAWTCCLVISPSPDLPATAAPAAALWPTCQSRIGSQRRRTMCSQMRTAITATRTAWWSPPVRPQAPHRLVPLPRLIAPPSPPPPPQRHRPSPTTTTTTTAWCCVGILNAKAAPRAGRGAVPRGGAAGGEHDELHGDHAHLPQHAGGSAASWLCYAMLRSDMLCYDMIWHSMLC